MNSRTLVLASTVLASTVAVGLVMSSHSSSQTPPSPPPRPPIETTKVEGTDNVYVFRNGNHQAMFVVTSAGVIATDPVAYGRPTGGQAYVDEIKKVTSQPIKYLIYSHHHFDHIAGGKAFKDAGATVVAHRRAKERLTQLNDPHTVAPDEAVGDEGRTITLGGTVLELKYIGLNHSDSTLVMRLPKEKIIFVVDLIPVAYGAGSWHDRLLSSGIGGDLDRQDHRHGVGRMIPGHPGPNGRLGTKEDAKNLLTFLQDASSEVKKAAREGKCWDTAEKEVKLPKYETWPGYQNNLPFVLRRYCGLWGRGT